VRRLLRLDFARSVGASARALIAVGLILVPPVLAQTIDPSVLGRIQSQLGAGVSPSQQLDQSRSQGEATTDTGVGPGETAEEIELRRQRSRVLLGEFYTPSAVEREYQQRLGDPDLRQFGYDLFRSTEGGSGPLTGEVGGNYILGIGDELVVSFQGATNDSRTARVDREGRLVVGQLRPIQAAGRSLGAVRSDLAAETRRTLLGTEVYVSLGSVRAISVFVGGEVERPGQYRLTSLGDVATALARAGGIRRSGSLRNVRIIRAGGGSTSVDLYGLLGIGTPPAVRLQDGDRIVVPVIGGTVAISGGVARPAIYELRGSISLDTLISYAGGALRPRGYKAAVSRIAPDGSESFVRVSGGSQSIIAGDAVQIVGGSAGGAQNRVVLRGYVLNPGPRPLSTADTVRDLLGEPEDLRLGTYMPMAILVRRDPVTSSRVFEPVNLITALRDAPTVPLRSDDRLVVFGQRDIQFLNSEPVRRIILGERNPLRQCRALDHLETLVQDTQSLRFNAITRGGFIIGRRIQAEELRRTNGSFTASQQEQAALTAERARQEEERARERQIEERERAETNAAYSEERRIVEENRRRLATRQAGAAFEDESDCPAIFEEEPELLPVLIEHAVGIGGAVRQPGAYPVGSPTPVSALISVAQGMAANARDVSVDVIRAMGEQAATERVAGGRDVTALASVMINPGDDLRVNAAQPQFEAGGVLLSGEFNRPGFYTIRKGETLSQLIARAGGLSSLAYPYGAIFTRRSVKELQEEGFRRTARELNAGLLAAIGRRGGDAGSVGAATALIDRLSTIEAPGRMVVEADPQVLNVRPELDTVLEAGDAIVMPKTPNFVLALGDVANPGALQFVAGKSSRDYLKEAGGLQATAEADRAFLVLPNGTAQPLRSSGWARRAAVVPPGSTIIVPKEIDPGKTLDIVSSVATIFGQFATAIASIAILATQ
jgi:protein involved in polysaccharide export with SLBB domain